LPIRFNETNWQDTRGLATFLSGTMADLGGHNKNPRVIGHTIDLLLTMQASILFSSPTGRQAWPTYIESEEGPELWVSNRKESDDSLAHRIWSGNSQRVRDPEFYGNK
jgi:hypothetical protein